MQHPPTAVDYESLVTLSLQLKWQHINLDVNFHVVIVALDEVALLRLASPRLAPACDRFILTVRRHFEPQWAMTSVWAKAQSGLAIKLTHHSSLGAFSCPLMSLLHAKMEVMAEALVLLRQRNQQLSRLLRDYPRATERGFCATDKLAFDVQKKLQRISIDAAILTVVASPAPCRTVDSSKRTVSFAAGSPRILGQADPLDRKPIATTRPSRLELLVLRGSRILRGVVKIDVGAIMR
ncbi:Aste57867_4172 [Aphanomyces stellatus]|uniref:Aste57867_4172 protein n=1 Tax=Aphanomyces stellatus TaxID=120398 RepID=A0A485KCC5_9STRA|nr:hypothetical protein As57867_004161 [Aphanomyces stellatus]VFT81297.1 Aste57867_4172 [Aphanomyces stellatus]